MYQKVCVYQKVKEKIKNLCNNYATIIKVIIEIKA